MARRKQSELLLEIRESERDDVEGRLAEALDELERRETYLERKRQSLQQAMASVREVIEQRTSVMQSDEFCPRDVSSLDRRCDLLEERAATRREQFERARKSVNDQERTCAEVREELREAQTALKAVEKHRERELNHDERIAQRKRSDRNDEIASRRWWETNK